MPSATTRQTELLHYLPEHRVLICKECRYAIQPSAVSRHLKELHHIYRSERQELLEYVQTLDLASPGDVILPHHKTPIPWLPVHNGFVCGAEGCGHLCVAEKRLKAHWATVHRSNVEPTSAGSVSWRPVNLQTFFRGNQLRYFIVSNDDVPPIEPEPEQLPTPDSQDCSHQCSPTSMPCLPTDWDSADVDLMKHFMSSTFYDLGHSLEIQQLWQTTMPELSFRHDFLKHGILACAALHLAHLNPAEKKQYHFKAAWHQNQGLPLFRAAIASPTIENCNALLGFSQLLIIHCLAAEEQDDSLLLVGGSHDSGLPDWLHVIRGSCMIFKSVWRYMGVGVFAPLVSQGVHGESYPLLPVNPFHEQRLQALATLPLLSDTTIDPICGENPGCPFTVALVELSKAFQSAQTAQSMSEYSVWHAVHLWPARIPDSFLEGLKARDPPALVLLAHYSILLEPFDSHWYMFEYRKRLLSRIFDQLDDKWRPYLQWPMEEAGLHI